MSSDQLFVFLEGDDDERFFDGVLRIQFDAKYNYILTIKFSSMKTYKVNNYLRSIEGMRAHYIFLADIDCAQSISEKKNSILKRYENLNPNNVFIVVKEIESWYLAGVSSLNAKKLKLVVRGSTDALTKESFDANRPKRFVSRIDFMVELLRVFSLQVGIANNLSFRHFVYANHLLADSHELR